MLDLVRDARRCLGWRLPTLFALLLLSSVFEGIGLTMLFPLLTEFGVGESGQQGYLQAAIGWLLSVFGIPRELGPLIVLTVCILYLQVVFQTAKSWMEADCQTRYTEYWHKRIFHSFIHANWAFFTAEKTAVRINAIMTEAGRISAAFYQLVQIANCVVMMLVYAAITLLSSWQMVAILVVFGVAIFLITRPLSHKGRMIGEQVSVVSEALQHRTMEFIHNAKLIKATATEGLAEGIFGRATTDFRLTFRNAGFHPKLIYAIYMIAGYTLLGGGLWYAIGTIGQNPGTVLVSVYIFLRLYVQLTNLQQFRQGYLLSAPALPATMRQVEAAERDAERLQGGTPLPAGPARLRFDDLTVYYGKKCALHALNFAVEPGQVVGITGASGAGKSTLVDVVVGLVHPAFREAFIDEIPLEEIALADWRRSIGYVGQETLLLNGTVASNIAWGHDCNAAEIEAAARMANAHSFISDLPVGYATEIGDRGTRLSGGQRQRLGLARALIGNKRLLILDEATSALDSESEHEIMAALRVLRGRVTVLMVAHRLSTLYEADTILMLEHGRLIESGSWSELIEQDGAFAKLWRMQQSAPGDSTVGDAACRE
jgi:ATP-binding cassette subfamily C protein